MADWAWSYFRQRKARVVPVHTNVIPISHRCAFNPSPLLPRRLQRAFESELYDELSQLLGTDEPVELMGRLCLAYRPACRSDSTAALGWARLLAKDFRWRLYEGTYEYILFDRYFMKLVDKGISVQAILLAWARDISAVLGKGWLWSSREDLQTLGSARGTVLPACRLQRVWLGVQEWRSLPMRPRVVGLQEESTLLDGMERLRDMAVANQLRTIAPRVDEHLRQT